MRRVLLVLICLVAARSLPAQTPAEPTSVIGLHLTKVPESLHAHLLPTLAAGEGLLVDKVASASPAERHGLKRHDILVSLDGTALHDTDHLARLLFAAQPNSNLALIRAGKQVNLRLALKDEDLPKGLVKLGGPPDVTIKCQMLDDKKLSVTFMYYRDTGKRESVTVAGSLPEIERSVQDLGKQNRFPARVQDLVEVALKRLRTANESQEK
jgi:PDZ domain